MAVIAVGDIHGNLTALQDLLAQLRSELGAGDTLVFLGDYIDRGRDSRGCIDAILDVRTASSAAVVCLRGNHEDWMLETYENYARHSWLLSMDALETIRSYSASAEQTIRDAMKRGGMALYRTRDQLPYDVFFDAMPPAHHAFFAGLDTSYEDADGFFCHAGVDPSLPELSDQSDETLMWGKSGFPRAYTGSKTVVYGHWNNAVLDASRWPAPRIVGNAIGIDTISHGVLTAIRLPDRRVFQSAVHQPYDRESPE